MPEAGIEKRPHQAILRYEEIAELVRIFAGLGVKAVRITGGEPLVRPDLYKLVEMITKIDGIDDISLTTNALLLEGQAEELAGAGLKRINISLDTLQEAKFAKITRHGSLENVWRGIEAAEKNHLAPIKLNVVAMRGINDDEFVDLALHRIDADRQPDALGGRFSGSQRSLYACFGDKDPAGTHGTHPGYSEEWQRPGT